MLKKFTLLLLLPFIFLSCEKEAIEPEVVQELNAESAILPEVSPIVVCDKMTVFKAAETLNDKPERFIDVVARKDVSFLTPFEGSKLYSGSSYTCLDLEFLEQKAWDFAHNQGLDLAYFPNKITYTVKVVGGYKYYLYISNIEYVVPRGIEDIDPFPKNDPQI